MTEKTDESGNQWPFMTGQALFSRQLEGFKACMEWVQAITNPSPNATPSASLSSDWVGTIGRMCQGVFGSGVPLGNLFVTDGVAMPWQTLREVASGVMSGVEPMAALGYTRAQQLQQQTLWLALIDCLKNQLRYQSLIFRIHIQGMQRMQEKLAQQGQTDQPVETVKAMYDIWIDAAEEVHADVALSEEFRETYGALSNAQLRLRHLQQQQIEHWCREQGMPTRSEVDSLGQRLQEIRRELRTGTFSSSHTDQVVAALKKELSALKKSFDTVRFGIDNVPSGKIARKTKTSVVGPSKKTVAKSSRIPVSRKANS